METNMNEKRGTFPADRPIEALTQEHTMVRDLANAYLSSDKADIKRELTPQITSLVEMHSRMEETVFYPAVRNIDSTMISHFEEEHHKVDDLLQTLKGASPDDPQCDQTMRQMLDMVLRHIQEEETQFFPKLERANLDMTDIGLQMQAFEANLVHAAAQSSEQRAR